MRASQPYLVLPVSVILVLMIAAYFSDRLNVSKPKAKLAALSNGLEYAYGRVVSETQWFESQRLLIVAAEELRGVLLKPNGQVAHLPSFVHPTNVFLSVHKVNISSDDLVCVVCLEEGVRYGISGKGVFRGVTPEEFHTWPHEPLLTNRILTSH